MCHSNFELLPPRHQDKNFDITDFVAPPAVRNLTIYEVDSKTVSLQWMPPEPANGELESYVISIGGKRKLENSSITLNVTEITYCNHREGFLCYENFELPPDAASSDMDIQIEVNNVHMNRVVLCERNDFHFHVLFAGFC